VIKDLCISILCLLLGSAPLTSVQAQYTAVEFVDAFLADNASGTDAVKTAFVDSGSRIWLSSSNQNTPIRNLDVSAYLQEINTVNASFSTKFNTVVSIHRKAGPLSTVFCSVHGRLVDNETSDTVYTRAIHSYKLVQHDDGWKILQLNIQNEDEPFVSELWPKELATNYPLESKENVKIYKHNRPFNVDEVDLAPLYPFEKELEDLLIEFAIQQGQIENESPFTIYISEDGEAVLGFVGDLSADQIESAKIFVSKMNLWYPAVKEKSSVKCKLIFSIK